MEEADLLWSGVQVNGTVHRLYKLKGDLIPKRKNPFLLGRSKAQYVYFTLSEDDKIGWQVWIPNHDIPNIELNIHDRGLQGSAIGLGNKNLKKMHPEMWLQLNVTSTYNLYDDILL